jgi:glucose/arabinose dehydrogenase
MLRPRTPNSTGSLQTRRSVTDRSDVKTRPRRLITVVRTFLGGMLVLLVALPLAPGQAVSAAGVQYTVTPAITGLKQPVYMTAPPGEYTRYFIVQKGGVIRIFNRGALLRTPFLNISSLVSTDSERGLLSMAFDPRYASNRRFYVYYTNLSGNIVVARFLRMVSNANRADPNSRRVLLRIPHPGHSNHNGGHLAFDPIAARNGRAILYISTGDGGGAGDPNNNAQNKSSRLGKLLRMNVNASRPSPVMVAYGLRNPWRYSFDRLNGNIRLGDVGQNSWEELDLFKHGTAPGVNYGWRKYEGRHLYHDQKIDGSRLAWPFLEYSHSSGRCTVIGGYTYRGSIASLYGHYLYADLCTGDVWMRKPGKNPVRMDISGQISSIVSFAEGNKGGLYIVSLNGTIYRLGT